MLNPLRRWFLPALFVLLCCCALPGWAVDSPLPASLKQALAKAKIDEQSLALAIVPLSGNGKARFFNADRPMNPASTMKLVTTYAALELLGPAYQWRTEFYTDGTLKDGTLSGNLYLKGGGDPKLNLQRLWLLLRDLRAAGVKRVTGDLVLERSYFFHPPLPEFNDDGGDPLRPFLVKPDALLINFKSVRLVVRAADGKVNLYMDPPLSSVSMVNEVALLPAKPRCPNPLIGFNLKPQVDNTALLVVKGKLAEGCSSEFYLSVLDHPSYAFDAVRALWQEMGASIGGKNIQGLLPQNARLLSRTASPNLADIIRDINKYSNNTMARQLFLSLGAQLAVNGDENDGEGAKRVIRAWLAKKGIKAPQLVLENGSGLSRNERISAAELAAILQAAWQSPYAAEFISSLPLVAIDGTMRSRLRGTALVGQAHIKTGALSNARAIAGFCRDRNGNTWAVVAILNGAKLWNASTLLDQVLLDVYQQPKP